MRTTLVALVLLALGCGSSDAPDAGRCPVAPVLYDGGACAEIQLANPVNSAIFELPDGVEPCQVYGARVRFDIVISGIEGYEDRRLSPSDWTTDGEVIDISDYSLAYYHKRLATCTDACSFSVDPHMWINVGCEPL